MSEFLLPAILNLFDPLNIFLMIAGLAGGIIVGALPGLTATMEWPSWCPSPSP